MNDGDDKYEDEDVVIEEDKDDKEVAEEDDKEDDDNYQTIKCLSFLESQAQAELNGVDDKDEQEDVEIEEDKYENERTMMITTIMHILCIFNML